MSQIELKHIDVMFQQKKRTVHAVKDVSLTIEKGEIFGIVGLSGAGKSTLVRTINYLQAPSQGQVIVDGHDLTKANARQIASVRRKIGFIFQNFNLIGNRTVAQNLAFALTAGGYPEKAQPARIQDLLTLVGLADRQDNYPAQLSGGQKQRVGIARALANDPDVLLCDEATSALDVETAEEIIQILKDINQRLHITIVFITHQLEVARSLFDRVAVMEAGQLVEQSSTYDLFAAPQSDMGQWLVNRFLDTQLPTRVAAQLARADGQLLALRYRGSDSLTPIITEIAKATDIDINIIQGRIEFIQERAIGVLAVYLTGTTQAVKQAIALFQRRVDYVEEVQVNE
ncbi:methionine ABC transporter ATP-binding protein [Lactiplantibacillus plantarum]|uniref:methionine ABC transporter ATP-binding protein n=1 Tax=Lactiplantibacillus plantarum TaxID=1590 RepID=UPI00145611FE|nr:ATP-binding cassette domain-containing protein [Lactiplantibacillus plantarum]NLS61567.1 ATP-binding cassette domain-containing protein [Lactiplantibacillus plantarum]